MAKGSGIERGKEVEPRGKLRGKGKGKEVDWVC